MHLCPTTKARRKAKDEGRRVKGQGQRAGKDKGEGGAPEDARPIGPSVVGSPLVGRLAHQLQVDHILGTVPYTGAYAVSACISTTNDHHILVLHSSYRKTKLDTHQDKALGHD